MEDMNGKHDLISWYHRITAKSTALYENISQRSFKTSDPKPLTTGNDIYKDSETTLG